MGNYEGTTSERVHPKLAQDLARHSNINLTLSRYTHTTRGEQSQALESLPQLSPVRNARQGQGKKIQEGEGANDLAFFDAQARTSVRLDAPKTAVGAYHRNPDISREKASKHQENRGEKGMRLLGLEPKTYGLKVRCSTD